MGEPARKLLPAVKFAQMTDEELETLVSGAVARGVEQALARYVPPKAPDGRLLGPQEAADFLGISTGALRHHVARKHISPDVRAGKGGVRAHQFSRATLELFRRRPRGNQEE